MSEIPQSSFLNLGIAPRLLEALATAKFTSPTPIQEKSIPVAIEGKDIIGIAQTGTGKTLAFGIPMLQRLAAVKGRGLILVPTRELALQVEESLMKIGKLTGLRTAVLIGGASMGRQIDMIQKNPHVIVATPGRLIDIMEQRRINLNDVRVLVLDEADRMLDMGFMPQIQKILATVPKERQTMLFSATMPSEIVTIAAKHMVLPVRVEIARAGTAADKVSQEVFVVSKNDKPRLLEALLMEIKGSVLVFTRTKFGAKRVARDLRAMGTNSAEIHSNRSLAQRREALEGFRSGKYRVLVATDIAARGIDVKGIEVVINFDLPDAAEDYVHRIGRTGRAGMEGRAISFATHDQGRDVRTIEGLVRKQIPIKKLPILPAARFSPRLSEADEMEGQRFGGQRGGNRGPRPGYGNKPSYGTPRPYSPSPSYAARPASHAPASHSTHAPHHAPAHTSAHPAAHSPSHAPAHAARGPVKFNPMMNTYERPRTSSPTAHAPRTAGGAEVPTMGGVPVRAHTGARPAFGSRPGSTGGFGSKGGKPRRGKSQWIPKKGDAERPSFKPKKGPRTFIGGPGIGGPVKF
jgi:ATP-dependent RNA helicase RhlE